MTAYLTSCGLLARASGSGGRSAVVTTVIIAILVMLAIVLLFFLGLILLRTLGSRRERKLLEKKEHLNPLVYDVLTEERSIDDTVATLRTVVPRRDRAAFEQVLLENIRNLKGREREALTGVFEAMGYADEDIANLRRRGMVRQAESAFHLGTMRTARAVPALNLALGTSRHPEVVFSCLNALSKIGTPDSIEVVIGYLASTEEVETLRVAEVILERKREFSAYLERWLQSGVADAGRLALLIKILGAMKDVRSVPVLARFLDHGDAEVRASAAFALGTIGDYTACDRLVAAMEDLEPAVRAETAEALGKLQCDAALPRLRDGLNDDDLSVRMNSAVALSQLGEEGREVLEVALTTMEESQMELVAEALEMLGARTGGEEEQ